MTEPTTTTTRPTVAEFLTTHGITATVELVRPPLSCARCRGARGFYENRPRKDQSITQRMRNLCRDCDGTAKGYSKDGDWRDTAREYRATFTRTGGAAPLTRPYWSGIGNRTAPTGADVLDALRSDASMAQGMTFRQFCDELGYSDDSVKAREVYNDCQRTVDDLRQFLGYTLTAALMECEPM